MYRKINTKERKFKKKNQLTSVPRDISLLVEKSGWTTVGFYDWRRYIYKHQTYPFTVASC